MTTLPLFKRNILVSIRPQYASKILTGEKTVELRRRFPNSSIIGATALIYSSSPVQSVVGFARIDDVLEIAVSSIWRRFRGVACIEKDDFDAYFSGLRTGFVISLNEVYAFETPIHAVDLQEEFGLTPPQSFRYINEEHNAIWDDERLQVPDRYEYNYRA